MDVELPPLLMRPTVVAPRLLLPVVLALFGHAHAVRAQAPAASDAGCVSATGPDAPAGAPDTATRAADTSHAAVRLFAAVSADEVRFTRQPRICVRLTGDARLDSVRVVARRNLASPVVTGTTYRNVYVAVEILGRLNAECIAARIVGAAPADSTDRCASIGAITTTNPAGPPRR